jgi:hypothetical protein
MFRTSALIAALAGAGGSLGLMLHVGRRNDSLLLLSLFGIWVLSPFAGLGVAWVFAKRWPARVQTMLYCLTLAITLGCLAIYGNTAFGPPRAKPASVFLMVPLATWILCAMFVFLLERLGRQRP